MQRIGVQVGIPTGGANLFVTQKLADHRQPHGRAHADRCKAVAQVMQPHLRTTYVHDRQLGPNLTAGAVRLLDAHHNI
jgi:hypothetical protein